MRASYKLEMKMSRVIMCNDNIILCMLLQLYLDFSIEEDLDEEEGK